MRWVCYIEVQGLYAAVARQAGLAPADRPVVVLRDGRVIDGCREAFAGGLVLGSPARQALRDVPHAAAVEAGACDGAAAARSWWDRCLDHTPYIEPTGLNQVFLCVPAPGSALTAELKAEVAQLMEKAAAYGFVAFAGVGPSRLVARAAALACKDSWLMRRPGAPGRSQAPATVAYVEPGEEERCLAPLPVDYLPAPAEVLRRLTRLGIRRIGEIARIAEGEWLRQFGLLGRQVALWSRGVDNEPVKPCYPARTLDRRVEFADEVRDRDHLEQVLARSAGFLANRLEARGEGCQQVSLTVERADGPPVAVARTLAKLQSEVYPLRQALQALLGEALRQAGATEGPGAAAGWDSGIPVTALTVELGLIGPMPVVQMDLWDDRVRRERDERLHRALTLLHERFPTRMVGLGPRQDLSWKEQMLGFNDPYRWTARS